MKRLLLAGMGLLLVNIAQAHDWKLVVNAPTEQTYIDESSIKVVGNQVMFWDRAVETPPIKMYGKLIAHALDLFYINCADQTYAIKEVVFYNADNKIVKQIGPVPLAFEPVIPESKGEFMLNYVCSATKRKAKSY